MGKESKRKGKSLKEKPPLGPDLGLAVSSPLISNISSGRAGKINKKKSVESEKD